MTRVVHAQSKTAEALKIGLHTNGMNILEWVEDESKAPSEEYLLMYVRFTLRVLQERCALSIKRRAQLC